MTDSDKSAPNTAPPDAPDAPDQAAPDAPDAPDQGATAHAEAPADAEARDGGAPADPGEGAEEDVPDDGVGDEAMRKLLKRSLAAPEVPVPDLVSGVQRKLRRRSRGKFYADGWSTARSRVNYVLVSVAMLLVLVIAYLVLGPTGISVR